MHVRFAVMSLGVKHIVVMGHGMCGGCKAALTREMHGTEPGEGGFIADWIALLAMQTKPAFVLVWLLSFYVLIGVVETVITFPRRMRERADSHSLPPSAS